jgi:hypothetical protein
MLLSRRHLCCAIAVLSLCGKHAFAEIKNEHDVVPQAIVLPVLEKEGNEELRQKKQLNTSLGLDLAKINSSSDQPHARFDALEESLTALERQMIALTAQLLALKAHLQEAKNTVYDQEAARVRQAVLLEKQMQEKNEKIVSLQKELKEKAESLMLTQKIVEEKDAELKRIQTSMLDNKTTMTL